MKCPQCGHKMEAHDEWGCVFGMRNGVVKCRCRNFNKSMIDLEAEGEHETDA